MPWITARQASLSITNSWSLPKLMSIESVMPSSHLILCRPLLLLPLIPPSIRANKHIKKCSISIRCSAKLLGWQKSSFGFFFKKLWKNPSKVLGQPSITRHHLITVRMAINKKSTNNKCWRGCGAKRFFLHGWLECKLVQPLWETVWRLLGNFCAYIWRNYDLNRNTNLMFTAVLFTIARMCPLTQEWIKKMRYICICSNMDSTRDCHTKWSEKKKDKYHMMSPICEI